MALVIFDELLVLNQKGIVNIKKHICLEIILENSFHVLSSDVEQILNLLVSVSFEYLEVSLELMEGGRNLFEHQLVPGFHDLIRRLEPLDVFHSLFHLLLHLLCMGLFFLGFERYLNLVLFFLLFHNFINNLRGLLL